MLAQMDLQDVVANNLANVNTPGFKRDIGVFEAFPTYLWGHLQWMGNVLTPLDTNKFPIGVKGQGVQLQATYTDFSPSSLRRTDNPFDVAMRGPGFFTVQTSQGERYTRDGSFTLDPNGVLVTATQGLPVLGEQGPISVIGTKVRIDDSGVVFVDGARVDRLKLVNFAKSTDFLKVGNNLYRSQKAVVPVPEGATVAQGFIENANVNTVRQMVDLINVMRTYEANQRMVIAQDNLLQKAVNDVPRLA